MLSEIIKHKDVQEKLDELYKANPKTRYKCGLEKKGIRAFDEDVKALGELAALKGMTVADYLSEFVDNNFPPERVNEIKEKRLEEVKDELDKRIKAAETVAEKKNKK